MAHINHSNNNQTIWHDGCPECDERARSLPSSLGSLDDINRIKAWHFMRAWRWSGGSWDSLPPSQNDLLLFDCLYAIGVFMERARIHPFEVEQRMIETHDEAAGRAGMPEYRITTALNGINITGIFVKGDLTTPTDPIAN